VPRPKPQPTASQKGHQNSTMGSHQQDAHTRSSISLLRRCFVRKLPSQHQRKPLILDTLRGGLASSSTSLLCQRLGYRKLLRMHHLHRAVAEITTTLSVPPRGNTVPPWALCTFLPTRTKCPTTTATHKATSPADRHHCYQPRWSPDAAPPRRARR
jgi:hypothetical protein